MQPLARCLILVVGLCGLTSCATGAPATASPTAGASETLASAVRSDRLEMPADSTTVRVRIAHSRKAVRIGGTGPWQYCPAFGGACKTSTKSLSALPASKGVFIGGRTIKGGVWVRPKEPGHFLSVNGKAYRGWLRLLTGGKGTLDVVEYVDLEEYLYGVLPKEVGAGWPAEALKAQAVISRTFALSQRSDEKGVRFDLVNDVRSQVYGGLSAEAEPTSRAVDDTRGQILIDKAGQPVEAFFHSSCGGSTEKPGAVWARGGEGTTSDVYAALEEDYCSADPYRDWTLSLSESSLRARLRKAGIRLGTIRQVEVRRTSVSGRAEVIRVVSSKGTRDIQGNRFRLALGPEALRSTRLDKVEKTRSGFRFTGHGWGHGVGLCQWGARGRAEGGQTYEQILKAYYPGARLVSDQPDGAESPPSN